MKQKPVTITALISQTAGYSHGTAAYHEFSQPVSYTYMEQRYQVCPVYGFPLPAFCHHWDNTDVILVIISALYLEQGLRLLSFVIRQNQITDQAIPAVLCIASCQEQQPYGISIDFDLLEDVLQIPVVPCYHCKSDFDDVKAAIAYARNQRFSYDCLDFSPSKLAAETTCCFKNCYGPLEKAMDAVLSTPFFGTLILIACFLFLLWLTLSGTFLLSQKLFFALRLMEETLTCSLGDFFLSSLPVNFIVNGLLPTLSCVIPLMLPALAVSFFLFALLDEAGFLPRLSFHADPLIRPWGGCGKQCLVMSKSTQCHLAGILESRRIQSPRERLASLITTCLIPCSGRLPLLLSVTSLWGITGSFAFSFMPAPVSITFLTAFFMAVVLLLPGFGSALATSCLLSHTLLKPLPSASVLELPRLRRPRLIRSVIPSAWNDTCFVIGRAGTAAILAGFFIWLLNQITVDGATLLNQCIRLLEPAGSFLGLDGIILTAFLLGTPANEITLPLMILIYLSQSHTAISPAPFPADTIIHTTAALSIRSMAELKQLLILHGWNWHRALLVVILTMFHCPCLPSLQMIHQETKSLKWTAAAALIPSLIGTGLCALINALLQFF